MSMYLGSDIADRFEMMEAAVVSWTGLLAPFKPGTE